MKKRKKKKPASLYMMWPKVCMTMWHDLKLALPDDVTLTYSDPICKKKNSLKPSYARGEA